MPKRSQIFLAPRESVERETRVRSHRILPISRLSTFSCLKRGQAGKQGANVRPFPSETYQREQKLRSLVPQHARDLVGVVGLVYGIFLLKDVQVVHFACPNLVFVRQPR